MPVKKTPVNKKKEVTPKKVVKKEIMGKGLTVEVFDVRGGKTSMNLPENVFGVKINKSLLAQAVRVYMANQRMGAAKTQTRGEVTGSTRKIYQQKGTGRARHGGIRAPIFVGGGAAHGPRPHDFSLSLPKKMKKQALFSALTSKQQEGKVKVVKGLETVEAKTKQIAAVIKTMDIKGNMMLVLPQSKEKTGNVVQAARNIAGLSLMPVNALNAYEVLQSPTMLFMQEAIVTLQKGVTEK